MADKRNVSGEVTIDHDSDARVAFELMKFIYSDGEDKQDYALELYQRCLIATKDPYKSIDRIKSILKNPA